MVARLRKRRTYRIIAYRRSPKPVSERLPSVRDRAALDDIEALTNPRIQQEYAARRKVRPEDLANAGDDMVLASFAYSGASRFTDGSYGVYYAAFELPTAIAESTYHTARFLAYTDSRPTHVYKRVLRARVEGRYDDLRGVDGSDPRYDPDPARYGSAQRYARELYAADTLDGIVYSSVRARGGTCVVAFRPRLISGCETAGFLGYTYDGTAIDDVFRIASVDELLD